ncbi:DNA polymerase IV [Microvirga terricola]|uniref:DNA polymerase IV n=1 Tax=Microvirga terricola TaxID=2719797 RepID=A0ABX0VFI5_9HYPH|nr:DNA polymerase IV [Microvirga terricola]NIX77720.1 DNA polymerase IV [Microvirga terricola]
MSEAPFCRDCLTFAASSLAERCSVCGSPRLLRHKERDTLAIAHVDCDAFFAAVEKRDDPSLADKPVIVGGGKRGVVSTCCYVARTYGVRSAMPMFKALEACPHSVVIKPNIDKYRIAGREVRQLMLELTPLVEPVSIDEAFLDLTGTERLHHGSPALTLAKFARKVEDEIGITISVGLSYNKFLAKIASDFQKPRGFSIIGRAEAPAFLADKPVSIIPGIGASAQTRLAKAGVTLIGHLRDVPLKALFEALGRDAQRLSRLAWGEDSRRVTPERETKSVSAETTFDTDLRSFEDLEPILWRLSEKVSRRLKAADLAGRSITLKLKDSEFRILTRSRSGLPPTQLAARLFDPARQMLKAACDGTAFRLIGIGASDLCDAAEADKGDLADQSVVRQAHMEAAIDKIRDKFGLDALQKGLALRKPQR